jgi:hypothetical protein
MRSVFIFALCFLLFTSAKANETSKKYDKFKDETTVSVPSLKAAFEKTREGDRTGVYVQLVHAGETKSTPWKSMVLGVMYRGDAPRFRGCAGAIFLVNGERLETKRVKTDWDADVRAREHKYFSNAMVFVSDDHLPKMIAAGKVEYQVCGIVEGTFQFADFDALTK